MATGSKSQTVGYKYYLGLYFAICYGPVDKFLRIIAGEREAWNGYVIDNETITIDADDLFGGEKREGGIEGDLDIMMGAATQTTNDYLVSKVGGLMPAFRGILGAVYKGGLISANNPYVKPWAFQVQRIIEGWDGGEAWYPAKAAIDFDCPGGLTAYKGDPYGPTVSLPGEPLWEEDGNLAYLTNLDTFETTASGTIGNIDTYNEDGEFVDSTPATYFYDGASHGEWDFADQISFVGHVRGLNNTFVATIREENGVTSRNIKAWVYPSGAFSGIIQEDDGEFLVDTGSYSDSQIGAEAEYYDGNVYVLQQRTWFIHNLTNRVVRKYSAPGGVPSPECLEKYDEAMPYTAGYFASIHVDSTGVWILASYEGGSGDTWGIILLNHDLEFDRSWTFNPDSIATFGVPNFLVRYPYFIRVSETTAVYGVYQLNEDHGSGPYVPGTITELETGTLSQNTSESRKSLKFSAGCRIMGRGTEPITVCLGQYSGMNPAHIIYEVLTNSVWGMGYPTAQIDDTSFTAAADTFYDEGLGLCLIWNQQTDIENFVQQVLDHAGAVYYADPFTGKFKLKPLRGDYDPETLTIYDEDNIISLDDYQRNGYGDAVNEIVVVYKNQCTGLDESISFQDLASVQAQGGVVSQTVQYPGLPTAELAARTAERDTIASSTPLSTCTITVNRSAWAEYPGNVIKVSWAKHGIEEVIFRVLTINYGTLDDGKLVVELAEDVYGLPSSAYPQEQTNGFVEPDMTPTRITMQDVAEAPYWDVARSLSPGDLSVLDADSAFVMAFASTENPVSLGFSMHTRISPADYADTGQVGSFAPSAVLASSVLSKTETILDYIDGINMDRVEVGHRVLIGSGATAEFCEITDIDIPYSTITVNRGILDTIPQVHEGNVTLFFIEDDFAADPIERATSDSVDVKLTAFSGGGETDLATATAMNVVVDQRQARPYPPGKVRINSQEFPAETASLVTVTWAHRDRLQQLVNYVDQDEDSIGPEASTTYTVRHYLDDSLENTQSGITGATSAAYNYSGLGTARVELESVRSGLINWQTYTHEFEIVEESALTYDTHFANVVLLLNMPGTDGSTAFTEVKGKTVSANGNAQIDTSLGYNTALFDGTGDWLSTPNHTDFGFGSLEVTIDALVRFNNYPVDNGGQFRSEIIGKQATGANNFGWTLEAVGTASSIDSVNFTLFTSNASFVTAVGTYAFALNTDYHIEACRDGNTLRVYVDGVQVGSAAYSGTVQTTTANVKIGSLQFDATFKYDLNGHIRAIRVTKGVCRHPGGTTFTPPTAPFFETGPP